MLVISVPRRHETLSHALAQFLSLFYPLCYPGRHEHPMWRVARKIGARIAKEIYAEAIFFEMSGKKIHAAAKAYNFACKINFFVVSSIGEVDPYLESKLITNERASSPSTTYKMKRRALTSSFSLGSFVVVLLRTRRLARDRVLTLVRHGAI